MVKLYFEHEKRRSKAGLYNSNKYSIRTSMDYNEDDCRDDVHDKLEEELSTIKNIRSDIRSSLGYDRHSDDDEGDAISVSRKEIQKFASSVKRRDITAEEDEEDESEAEEADMEDIRMEEEGVGSSSEESQIGVYDFIEKQIGAADSSEEEEEGESVTEEGQQVEEGEFSEDSEELDWLVPDGKVDSEYEAEQDRLAEERKKQRAKEKEENDGKPKKRKAIERDESEDEEDDREENFFFDRSSDKKVRKKKKATTRKRRQEVHTSDEEDEVRERIELKMDKTLALDPALFTTYKTYFVFYIMSMVKPDYRKYLTEKIAAMNKELPELNNRFISLKAKEEQDPNDAHIKRNIGLVKAKIEDIKAKLENFTFQVNAEQEIKTRCEEVISFVICFLQRDGGRANGTLLSILVREDPKKKVSHMSFQRVSNHSATCSISGRAIKAGQAWIASLWKGDMSKEESIIDYQWVQFLSFWQTIIKHSDIIKDIARSEITSKTVNGKIPQDRLTEVLNNTAKIQKHMRLLMASFAYFYKIMHETREGEFMLKKVNIKWYTVCSVGKNKK